jgi:putative ABC transport system permease protein
LQCSARSQRPRWAGCCGCSRPKSACRSAQWAPTPALAPALGINPWTCILAGLALANGLSAFAGAIAAQLQGFADVHMGFGVLINGLAAVIIGETLIGRDTVLRQLAAPLVGSIVYYQLVSLGLALGLKPADLKLVTGLFVLATLALPALRRGAEPERLRE